MVTPFEEKSFFLRAFRGHTLTFFLGEESGLGESGSEGFAAVVDELVKAGVRVLVLHPDDARVISWVGEKFSLLPGAAIRLLPESSHPALAAVLWRHGSPMLHAVTLAGAPSNSFLATASAAAIALRLPRVIVLAATGGLTNGSGRFISYLNPAQLADSPLVPETGNGAARQQEFLTSIRAMLDGGVEAVSLCRLGEVGRELFTFEGSGTFFSRHHYCRVRPLGWDDAPAVMALIRRGEKEGFLLPRSPEDSARLILSGYGAFIGDGFLAGLAALLTTPYREERAGEIAGIYALTRFKGEGIGGYLLKRIVEDGARSGLSYLFAVTTHLRVVDFFRRHGFRPVSRGEVPDAKWHRYDPERRRQVTCMRRELSRVMVGAGDPPETAQGEEPCLNTR
ncbi:MAG: GNAT family N-acetyltransferase [Magnetococcales bacterium]|nr:GNAT family N-acetyltransferase [Magnetococcales bacterium]MBF0155850.1 GNAT family N-acetyltransferase [Magnetococcales bacterium]